MSQTAITKLVGLLAIAATSLTDLRATQGPTDLLADQADAVVVAEVLSGQQTGYDVAFVLLITRTIKGGLAAGTAVNVSGGVRRSGSGSLRGHYGLWFLKKAGGQWALLPVIQAVALGTGTYIPLSKDAACIDQYHVAARHDERPHRGRTRGSFAKQAHSHSASHS